MYLQVKLYEQVFLRNLLLLGDLYFELLKLCDKSFVEPDSYFSLGHE